MVRTGKTLQFCKKCKLVLCTLDYRINGLLCPRCETINEPANYTEEQLDQVIKKWHAALPKKIKADKNDIENIPTKKKELTDEI